MDVELMVEQKELRIYDYLNAIFNKTDLPYDKSIAPAYMLCIWLSHDAKLIEIVNSITPYLGIIPDNLFYEYFMMMVPRGKRFIKWIPKEKIDKKVEEVIHLLMEKRNISYNEAKLYIRKD
jgi:hypothetical protein